MQNKAVSIRAKIMNIARTDVKSQFIYLHNCVNKLLLFLFNMKIYRGRHFEESSQDGNKLSTNQQVATG